MARITNQQRIDKDIWTQADLEKAECPKCGWQKMKRKQQFIPVLGYIGYLECINPECDFQMEKPLKSGG